MSYVADEDKTLEFVTLLWRHMQNTGSSPMSRKEMAARLSGAGFYAKENNVTQWLNGHRLPPPGLPYYSTIALDLDEEDGQLLAWAYSRSYKDNRKGAGKSGLHAVPDQPAPTDEQMDVIQDLKEAQDKADEAAREGNSHETRGSDV